MNKPYLLESTETILTFPFKSPGWQSKLAIGAALFFANYIIPILPSIFLAGYTASIMRATIAENAEPTLPEWDEWGTLFKRGLKVTAATVIYMLPGLVCIVLGYVFMFIAPFVAGISTSTSHYREAAGPMVGIMMLGTFGGMALFFVGFLLFIPLSLLLPPAIAHVVGQDSFVAAFRVSEWWRILRANFKGFFTAMAISSGVYMILLLVAYVFYLSIILCFLFPVALSITAIYISLVSAVTLGEAYRKGVENLAQGTPDEVVAPV